MTCSFSKCVVRRDKQCIPASGAASGCLFVSESSVAARLLTIFPYPEISPMPPSVNWRSIVRTDSYCIKQAYDTCRSQGPFAQMLHSSNLLGSEDPNLVGSKVSSSIFLRRSWPRGSLIAEKSRLIIDGTRIRRKCLTNIIQQEPGD